jgi:trehalose utilization protein
VISRPDGSEALRQEVLAKRTHRIRIPVPADQTGKAWRISLIESREGELLRVSCLTFMRGSGNVFATHPTRLLVPANP